MIRRESKSSLLLRHWLRANPMPQSCTFEVKDTCESSALAFDRVDQAQLDYALAIESDKGVLLRNQGGSGEPDYTYHRNEPAYICIRYPKAFYLIRVQEFIKERSVSRRKSLMEDRAKLISEVTVNL